MNSVRDGRLDEALTRLTGTGPEFGGGLANHGPMAAEALLALGRADAVEPWVDRYRRRLDAAPRSTAPIDDDNWREALSDVTRVADWTAYLGRQLEERPWQEVLAQWWERLLPGTAASATHGVIRTAHAARALGEAYTTARRQELAAALAYWAARYLEVPQAADPAGRLTIGQALAAMPLSTRREPGLITEHLSRLDELAGFGEALTALQPAHIDADAALYGLTREFAANYLCIGDAAPVIFVHTVTAPTAVRSILPLLPEPLHLPTHDALWHVGAGIHAAFAGRGTPRPDTAQTHPAELPDLDDLADRAVAAGDEHAIKFTEACLREWRHAGDDVFLRAADRALTDHFRLD